MKYRVLGTTMVGMLTMGLMLGSSSVVEGDTARAACDPGRATLSKKLVPSCGTLFGSVSGAWTKSVGPKAHKRLERKSKQTLELYRFYYRGNTKFPSKRDIKMAREPGKNRVLMLNWRVAQGMSWADVARGKADKRIDAEGRYIRKNFKEPFFLVLHHEPDRDVRARRGSGWEAKDYAAMYRRTVKRLRSQGATNVVTVWTTVGFSRLTTKPWFDDLYPGDKYVDWVGWDPYVITSSKKATWPGPRFKDMMNNTDNRRYPNGRPYRGMYQHITKRYPGKPIILPEMGMLEKLPASKKSRSLKATFFDSIRNELRYFPAIRGLAWFETPNDKEGFPGYNSLVGETGKNLRAWRRLVNWSGNVSFSSGKIRYNNVGRAPAAKKRIRVKLKTRANASKLRVNVNPNKKWKNYKFKVQKFKRGRWSTVKVSSTRGRKDVRTINRPKGTYRVVVPSQHGRSGGTSRTVWLTR